MDTGTSDRGFTLALLIITLMFIIPIIIGVYLEYQRRQVQPVEVQKSVAGINWRWRAYINPTAYSDKAYAVCEAGDYIYVVGSQSCGGWICGRIEVRHKVNGSLVNAFNIEGVTGDLIDCAIGGGKLYAISRNYLPSSIHVFDLEFIFDPILFKLNVRSTAGKGYFTSILFFDNHIYVAGYGYSGLDLIVEKRRADNLELVKERTTNPPTGGGEGAFIGINPVTKQLWVVGHTSGLWIEILDLDLNLVKVVKKIDIGGRGRVVVFDEEGNAYVVGEWFVAKFDKEGR